MRLQSARVRRFYRGGAELGRLRGVPEEDGYFPEDWLGSVTEASGSDGSDAGAGLSRLDDGRLLRDAIEADPVRWLGDAHVAVYGTSTALLVKLLDAAERLPVHLHPDRAFARRELASPFGKTEAWIVLATRGDDAEVWVGLSEPIEQHRFRGYIERQDREALLASLNRIRVRAGDVVFVPAGLPHAIGAGVLLVELQEPTDLSIVCEWEGFPIAPDGAHLGLGWNTAIRAIDLRAHEPIRNLPEAARTFFFADTVAAPAQRFAVLLATEGGGSLDGIPVRAGDAFAVPATTDEFSVRGDVGVLRCLAPDPR
jgi:mannose-6-phosphate isomerase